MSDPGEPALATLRQRRADRDLTDIVTVGADGLRELIDAHISEGLSKFVVRPLTALSPQALWHDDLHWLAETVLPLQT